MTHHKPGRELDILIAEKVMGLVLSPDKKYYYEDGIMAVNRINPLLPHYSTDIAAAWLVVEKLSRDFLFSIHGGADDWEAEFNKNDGRFLISADTIGMARAATAPLAICLAALEAMKQ